MEPNTNNNNNQPHFAMDIVFETPILVQNIVSFLPVVDLLVAQKVNTLFESSCICEIKNIDSLLIYKGNLSTDNCSCDGEHVIPELNHLRISQMSQRGVDVKEAISELLQIIPRLDILHIHNSYKNCNYLILKMIRKHQETLSCLVIKPELSHGDRTKTMWVRSGISRSVFKELKHLHPGMMLDCCSLIPLAPKLQSYFGGSICHKCTLALPLSMKRLLPKPFLRGNQLSSLNENNCLHEINLQIDWNGLRHFDAVTREPTRFHSLTKLSVTMPWEFVTENDRHRSFQLLLFLIHSSSNLVSLELEHNLYSYTNHGNYWTELFTSVKEIKIIQFQSHCFPTFPVMTQESSLESFEINFKSGLAVGRQFPIQAMITFLDTGFANNLMKFGLTTDDEYFRWLTTDIMATLDSMSEERNCTLVLRFGNKADIVTKWRDPSKRHQIVSNNIVRFNSLYIEKRA